MKLNYFSKTVVGLVRKANEDNIGSVCKPNKFNINLRIVCDGMGGHIGGAKASKIAVQSIVEYFSNNPNPVPQVALKEAISFANLQIFGSAQAEPEFKGMGTTCTALLESEGLIYIAHVGDSRIYIHTDHKLYRVTKDHSYVQDLVDKGEITDQQMETHPNKNQLTRALGIADRVEVDVVSKPILAKSGDYFMLCSDGLSGLINDRMINSVLKTEDSIETMVNNLITMAEAAGGHDNISVDLIEILESEHIKTQFVNKNNEDLIDTKTQKIVIDN
jgi:protein phosphatase